MYSWIRIVDKKSGAWKDYALSEVDFVLYSDDRRVGEAEGILKAHKAFEVNVSADAGSIPASSESKA